MHSEKTERQREREREREKERERLFCFHLSRLQRNKWIGLCKVCHPNDAYLWQVILLGKEFVLLCKMIGKQQKMSSCRSAYQLYHIFLAFLAGIQKILRQRMVMNLKIGLLKSKKRF